MGPDPHAPALTDPATSAWHRKTMIVLAGTAVVGLVLATSAAASHYRSGSDADELARTGTRANGTVKQVDVGSRGTEFLHLIYPGADGRTIRATIRAGSGHIYRPGDQVAVEYDPADPARVRTDQESNAPGGLVALTLLSASFAVSSAIIFMIGALFYRPFLRALRRGAVWLPAVTTLGPDSLAQVVVPSNLGDLPGTVLCPSAKTRLVPGIPVHYLAYETVPVGRRTALLRVPGSLGRARPKFLLVNRQG